MPCLLCMAGTAIWAAWLLTLCCCRKRAGADVITAPAKGSTMQSKLAAQLEARKKGTAVATSRSAAAGR
jgi:hypothetical protein